MNMSGNLVKSSYVIMVFALLWHSSLTEARERMAFPEEDWEFVEPAEENVDSAMLAAALGYLEEICGPQGISQVMVVRRGRVVWAGPHIDARHNIYSCTKSYAALVVGLLIDDGKLSLETRFADVFPEYEEKYPDLTVRHALTLTSGYHGEWPRLWIPAEPQSAPGEMFHYANGLQALARVVTKVADEPIDSFFRRRIAEPIGYTKALEWGDWGVIDEHVVHGASGGWNKGIHTNARNIARMGHLLLNHGKWKGQQLVSSGFIEEATRPQVSPDCPPYSTEGWYWNVTNIIGAYGYLFWVNGVRNDGTRIWPSVSEKTYAMVGNWNNVCFVFPEWELVFVRMGADKLIPVQNYDGFFRLLGESLTDL